MKKELKSFSELKGEILKKISILKNDNPYYDGDENDGISFVLENNEEYHLYGGVSPPCQDLYIESIVGDLNDLIGVPILMAEEVNGENEYYEYTFYKIATIKGYLDIRFIDGMADDELYGSCVMFHKVNN